MKTKQQKSDSLKEIQGKLKKAKITIFTSFAPAPFGSGKQQGQKGLNVTEMRGLRTALRPLEAEYSVEKKTLFSKALPSSGTYPGSLGVTYGYGDVFAVAKAVYQFAKKNAAMKLFGAYLGSEFIDEAKLVEMAKLPTKEVLLGRLVGMLSYPMRSFAVVLNQVALKK